MEQMLFKAVFLWCDKSTRVESTSRCPRTMNKSCKGETGEREMTDLIKAFQLGALTNTAESFVVMKRELRQNSCLQTYWLIESFEINLYGLVC